MASYIYKSWQTINLPQVENDTYFRILDHPSESPEDEVEGVVYDGLILAGFNIQNLNEIVAQYVLPNDVSFVSSLQLNPHFSRIFYIYYSDDSWTSFTMDDLTVIYDWSYENDDRVILSEPMNDLLDARQYIPYSVCPPPESYTLKVNIDKALDETYVLTQIQPTHLTFIALEDGTFSFTKKGTGNDIEYSLDDGDTWTTLASGTNTPRVTTGQQILWRGELIPNTSSSTVRSNGIGTFSSTGRFDVSGSIMSLLYGNYYQNKKDLTGYDYAFCALFSNCSKLINTEDLLLSATTLSNYCYAYIFDSCTNLITPPELQYAPAAAFCYRAMFSNCSSLMYAPEVPLTTTAQSCCTSMFNGCTSLITPPTVLPATTLDSGCYRAMFYNCTALEIAPELPAAVLAEDCYRAMFDTCTALEIAPELPAAVLAENCYLSMFHNCIKLKFIKCLATDIRAVNCTNYWVSGVASGGTFVKDASMTGWTRGASGIPTRWTIEDGIPSPVPPVPPPTPEGLIEKRSFNYIKYLPDINVWPGEFNWDYSYDYLVTKSTFDPGTFVTLTIGNHKFTIAHTCYRYCIYYFNQYGGWDSFLFSGKTLQNDNLSRLSYKKNYVAGALDYNKIDYLTTINEKWELNTSFIADIHSEKMRNLLASNKLYLHDLDENKIIPINITNSNCEHKTYKNQGRKLYTYTIEVENSQPKYRV